MLAEVHAVTRDEHLAWAKSRALEYLDRGDFTNSLASFISDMNKHDELATPAFRFLTTGIGMRAAMDRDERGMRHFIEGFN